jgi:hypothetical protein
VYKLIAVLGGFSGFQKKKREKMMPAANVVTM